MSEPMIAHIVAASENNVIGNGGELPWSIPEDMKWFRERTKGRALVMGRKTFESVGHPLPHRLNVVVTRQKDYAKSLKAFPEHSPVVVVSTIEEGVEYCKKHLDKYENEIFIIGGGEIYRQSMETINTLFLTRIHTQIEGDTLYPDVPSSFTEVERREFKGSPSFSIISYKRK